MLELQSIDTSETQQWRTSEIQNSRTLMREKNRFQEDKVSITSKEENKDEETHRARIDSLYRSSNSPT